MSWFIIGRLTEISKSYVFPSQSQCICHSCKTADEEIRNSGCHGSLPGDWQWQMIPSSCPKVWRILDVFLPLFCFPKQEGESLRFFWGLGQHKKVWDVEVRSGPVAISREKKTHLFSSFSLSAGVKHGDLERILFECHISKDIVEITIRVSSRIWNSWAFARTRRNGAVVRKRCIKVKRNNLSQILFKYLCVGLVGYKL